MRFNLDEAVRPDNELNDTQLKVKYLDPDKGECYLDKEEDGYYLRFSDFYLDKALFKLNNNDYPYLQLDAPIKGNLSGKPLFSEFPNGLPKEFRGLNLGKKCYYLLAKEAGGVILSGNNSIHFSSGDARRVHKSLDGFMDMKSKTVTGYWGSATITWLEGFDGEASEILAQYAEDLNGKGVADIYNSDNAYDFYEMSKAEGRTITGAKEVNTDKPIDLSVYEGLEKVTLRFLDSWSSDIRTPVTVVYTKGLSDMKPYYGRIKSETVTVTPVVPESEQSFIPAFPNASVAHVNWYQPYTLDDKVCEAAKVSNSFHVENLTVPKGADYGGLVEILGGMVIKVRGRLTVEDSEAFESSDLADLIVKLR